MSHRVFLTRLAIHHEQALVLDAREPRLPRHLSGQKIAPERRVQKGYKKGYISGSSTVQQRERLVADRVREG